VNCFLQSWHQVEPELRGWLMTRLANRGDADDLLQDIFLKAIRRQDSFCELRNARAWLFEVARNALIDRFRLSREQVELPEDLCVESPEMVPVESLAACLPRVLSELSADDREAITLCDLQGMSQQAFADLKGISLPGAKSRIQRARRRMRAQLTSACQVSFDESGHVSDFVPRPPLD
jgi:RNA polymerase sigma-70 factor (ECF subfamily)